MIQVLVVLMPGQGPLSNVYLFLITMKVFLPRAHNEIRPQPQCWSGAEGTVYC